MRLAGHRWNVVLIENGKSFIPYYYGFKKKAEAKEMADKWNAIGRKAHVYDRHRGIRMT